MEEKNKNQVQELITISKHEYELLIHKLDLCKDALELVNLFIIPDQCRKIVNDTIKII